MSRQIPIIPSAFRARYSKIIGEENKVFLKYCRKPLRKSIRINTLKVNDPDALVNNLKDQGWNLEPVPWYKYGYWVGSSEPGKSLEYFLGYIYPQEAASMIPPLVLKPERGDYILDMAASPGSKTTQIAQIMENKGAIVANEKDMIRIKPLRYNIETMGVLNTIVTRMDGVWFKNIRERFDKVLLDAPCSSEGVIRKSWNVLSRWNINSIQSLSTLQKGLISAAIQTMKRDGVLVYSTCTLAPEENEEVIDFALREFDVEIEDISLRGLKSRHGLTEWEGRKFDKDVKKALRIWPQDNDTEAFFVARLRKI